MMHSRKLILAAALAIAGGLLLNQSALAQPRGKVTRFVVPYPAGGGTDVAARLLTDRIRTAYPDGLVVDNRPGAAGRLGVEQVKNSAADGATVLFTPDFTMNIFPHTYKKLSYDPQADFVPVAMVGSGSYAITAGPGLPAEITNMPQLIDWLRANPKSASFASTAAGSGSHFMNVMLARRTGINILNVAYKGGAPALQDLLGGQIPVSINPVGEVLPLLGTHKLRVLATTGARRSRFMPNVPTLAELGYPDLVGEFWVGIFVPAGTPVQIVDFMTSAINAAVQTQELKDAYAKFGMDTVRSTPAEFAAVLREEIARWGPTVKSSGFTAED